MTGRKPHSRCVREEGVRRQRKVGRDHNLKIPFLWGGEDNGNIAGLVVSLYTRRVHVCLTAQTQVVIIQGFFVVSVFFFFLDKVSVCISRWPWTLSLSMPQPSECWHKRKHLLQRNKHITPQSKPRWVEFCRYKTSCSINQSHLNIYLRETHSKVIKFPNKDMEERYKKEEQQKQMSPDFKPVEFSL